MKPYTETIPGTEVKFEMLPIPGGTFEMGSPPSEAKRGEDEGPQHPVQVGPFWMGKFEVTWDEYDQFAFSLDLKKKTRENVDLTKQPETEKKADAVTRPTPPYADETFGLRPQRPAGHLHHPPRGDGILPMAVGQDRQGLSPAHRGRVGIRLPRRDQDGLLLGRRRREARRVCLGRRQRREAGEGRQEEAQSLGPATTCTATSPSGAWTTTVADVYKVFSTDNADRPGRCIMPDAKEYPYVVRGGSWDDDADKLRSAARRGSNPEWSVQDPQRPQSIWWHTDATCVGFRIVRPLTSRRTSRG